jgi:hypothetical protein
MKRFAFLILLPFLVGWDKIPGSGADDCDFSPFSSTNRTCFIDLTGAGATSGWIKTDVCENISVGWIADIATEAHVNSLEVRWSNDSIEDVDTSTVVGGAALTGDPATGLDRHYGFDAYGVWVRKVAPDDGATGRVSLQCHGAT